MEKIRFRKTKISLFFLKRTPDSFVLKFVIRSFKVVKNKKSGLLKVQQYVVVFVLKCKGRFSQETYL